MATILNVILVNYLAVGAVIASVVVLTKTGREKLQDEASFHITNLGFISIFVLTTLAWGVGVIKLSRKKAK